MIKLKISLAELATRATVIYMAVVFMMRGLLLKRRLRYAPLDRRRESR
jgi:hypothetical protein